MKHVRLLYLTALTTGLCAFQCGGNPELPGTDPVAGASSGGQAGFAGKPAGEGGKIVLPNGGDAGECSSAGCGNGGEGGNEPLPACGDGAVNQAGEKCDDGNDASGDGCTGNCQLEANFACPTAGEPCVSTVECGDGAVNGDEQCDDGNDRPTDGCSARCELEAGWSCPFPGVACEAAGCGDALLAGFEQCDDGNARGGDGCSVSCRLEDGFGCPAPGEPCAETTCGDEQPEGSERCDDGNYDLGDGCTPLCDVEPDCTAGPCSSLCGDGLTFGAEECDDGNTRDGDGCAATCEIEHGYRCTLPPRPEALKIPIVIRDFDGFNSPRATAHPDFEFLRRDTGVDRGLARNVNAAGPRGADMGQPGETFVIKDAANTPVQSVSLAGKPVYSRIDCDRTGAATDSPGCSITTRDADSFHSWYTDGPWVKATSVKQLTLLNGAFDADANFLPGGSGYTFDSRFMLIDGSIGRTPGFFPIDELGVTGRTCGAPGVAATNNFHFTSEVRYWFAYDASQSPPPELRFSGDDDVFVYVNGHLALDIGGVHARLADSFVIDAANAAAWGLEDGNIYEIAVFQAERNQCESNYWLTLKGFFASTTECTSECGDGKVANDELCDDGEAQNTGEYGKCGPDCKTRGPYCGDGKKNGLELCDDGVNISVYDFDGEGCAPGCMAPPYCGDAEVQSSFEQCDDGDNDGRYGGCEPTCELAPRCGDGTVQKDQSEQCDDGNRANGDGCDVACMLEIPK